MAKYQRARVLRSRTSAHVQRRGDIKNAVWAALEELSPYMKAYDRQTSGPTLFSPHEDHYGRGGLIHFLKNTPGLSPKADREALQKALLLIAPSSRVGDGTEGGRLLQSILEHAAAWQIARRP